MQKKEKVNISVLFPVNEHERFKKACIANDVTMAAKLLAMAKQFSDKSECK